MFKSYFPEGDKRFYVHNNLKKKKKKVFLYSNILKILEDSGLGHVSSCFCATGGQCFHCVSRVFYYLEVWTWKVLSALSSHWLQCHPALQPPSMGSRGMPHPAADVSPIEYLLQCIPSPEHQGLDLDSALLDSDLLGMFRSVSVPNSNFIRI